MNVTLSPETQKLLEEQMRKGEFGTPDDLLRIALQQMSDSKDVCDYDELDAETRAAIEEGEAQYQRGEGRPWEEFREEFRARFVKK